MNVETSIHDERWTTRRRVMMKVDMKRTDDGDWWWDVGCGRVGRLPMMSAGSVTNWTWRRSFRTS